MTRKLMVLGALCGLALLGGCASDYYERDHYQGGGGYSGAYYEPDYYPYAYGPNYVPYGGQRDGDHRDYNRGDHRGDGDRRGDNRDHGNARPNDGGRDGSAQRPHQTDTSAANAANANRGTWSRDPSAPSYARAPAPVQQNSPPPQQSSGGDGHNGGGHRWSGGQNAN